MDRQRRRMLSVALATGAVAAWPVRNAMAVETRQVTVALTARNSLYHLPLVLAERLGYFRQQSLQVNLLAHESGAAAVSRDSGSSRGRRRQRSRR